MELLRIYCALITDPLTSINILNAVLYYIKMLLGLKKNEWK